MSEIQMKIGWLHAIMCKISLHDWTPWEFSHNNMPEDPKHWFKVYKRGCRHCPELGIKYRPLKVSEVFDSKKGDE